MNFWFIHTWSHQGLPGSISAGRSHALHCVAEGSRPAADITWWKDGKVGKHNSLSHRGKSHFSLSTFTSLSDKICWKIIDSCNYCKGGMMAHINNIGLFNWTTVPPSYRYTSHILFFTPVPYWTASYVQFLQRPGESYLDGRTTSAVKVIVVIIVALWRWIHACEKNWYTMDNEINLE